MKCPEYVSPVFIQLALNEDIGRGDVTTSLISGSSKNGHAVVKAKEDLILCGIELAVYIFKFIDESLTIDLKHSDAAKVKAGSEIMTISGNCASILKAERMVLNFLQRLSGVATITAEYVTKIDRTSKTRITDTRKTTPGWRTLEKYAVRTGGGSNHRFGLDDGIMIKDNHIAMAGSIASAVKAVREKAHHLLKIEVETTNLSEVKQAIESGADVIMLDNMDIATMKQALDIIGNKAVTEISGGVTLEKIELLSKLGADFISTGAITHSAISKDINLTLKTC